MSLYHRVTARVVTAVVLTVTGCSEATSPTPDSRPPTIHAENSGALRALAGDRLPVDVAVRVLTAAGAPMAEMTVNWELTGGGGGIDAGWTIATTVTDADGRSRMAWRLGQSGGENTLVATLKGGASVTFRAQGDTVARIVFTPDTLRFSALGDTLAVSARAEAQDGAPLATARLTWSSRDEAVARSPAEGRVLATGAGSTSITVAVGALQFTLPVVVVQVPTRLTVSAAAETISVGGVVRIDAIALDRNGNAVNAPGTVRWSSSAATSAIVNDSGIVRGVATGTATLRAQAATLSADIPIAVRPVSGRRIAAGGTSSCVIEADGRAFCWGLNDVGQLGRPGASETCTTYPIIANYACSTVPVAVNGGHAWKQIDIGLQFACGLETDGTAYCWGSNERGQLGNPDALEQCGLAPWGGLVPCSRTPLRVATTEQFAWIGTGARSACALTPDGRAFCWGINGAGAVGSGALTGPILSPLPVTGGLRFRQLTVGEEFACGVTLSGDTFCWGDGASGALGDGSAGFGHRVASPTAVRGAHRFGLVAAGSIHSCALTVDGRPWCWGDLAGGALGYDASVITEPKPTVDPRALRTLTLGVNHSCGLDADSMAWCWGSNNDRALGTMLTEGWGTLRPVPVSSRASFESIDAGWAHTCGVRTGGGVYCWGNNTEGEVGDGTTVMRVVPTRVQGSAFAP